MAHFLTQCLFCFFAEDVGLLPGRMFERLLGNKQATPERLGLGLTQLFGAMRDGGLYGVDDIPWFNGGLFQTIAVPALSAPDLAELRRLAEEAEEAARAVNFLVSDDAGLMTGAIVNFDQSVWGAVAGGMPVPEGPMRL